MVILISQVIPLFKTGILLLGFGYGPAVAIVLRIGIRAGWVLSLAVWASAPLATANNSTANKAIKKIDFDVHLKNDLRKKSSQSKGKPANKRLKVYCGKFAAKAGIENFNSR